MCAWNTVGHEWGWCSSDFSSKIFPEVWNLCRSQKSYSEWRFSQFQSLKRENISSISVSLKGKVERCALCLMVYQIYKSEGEFRLWKVFTRLNVIHPPISSDIWNLSIEDPSLICFINQLNWIVSFSPKNVLEIVKYYATNAKQKVFLGLSL